MQPTTPSGSLTTIASWVDSIGGITRPARVAADLGVVVECRGAPLDLVAILDQRLAALGGHRPRQIVAALAKPPGDLVEHLAALERRRPRPARECRPGRGDRAVELLRRGRADRRDRLGRERVLDLQRVALAGDALAADQEQRVAHAAEPALETGSRPVASALRPASSVSSGRTSASFSARRCCQVTKIIARTVTANSNVAIK